MSEVDQSAVRRLAAMGETSEAVLEDWNSFPTANKIIYITEAIQLIHAQIEVTGDEDIRECMGWEISELEECLLFYGRICGHAPVEGQLSLLGSGA